MITRIENRSLINDIYKYDVVLLIMGINNEMSKGFNKEISVNFPDIKREEAKNGYGDKRKYGKTKTIFEKNLVFCVCYALKNGKIDTNLLEECIFRVENEWKHNKIALSVGEYISDDIFGETFNEYFIYTDTNDDFSLKYYHEFNILHKKYKENEISRGEYEKMRNKLSWEQKNGVLNEMPDGWTPIKNDEFSFLRK